VLRNDARLLAIKDEKRMINCHSQESKLDCLFISDCERSALHDFRYLNVLQRLVRASVQSRLQMIGNPARTGKEFERQYSSSASNPAKVARITHFLDTSSLSGSFQYGVSDAKHRNGGRTA
jgi:hypothetical protein